MFGPTKYPPEKNLGPTKYLREKILDPRNNTLEKKLGSTKYPRKKTLNPRKTHEKKFWSHKDTVPRWHGGTRPTRSTMTRDTRNIGLNVRLNVEC